jgi:hypothetical protein
MNELRDPLPEDIEVHAPKEQEKKLHYHGSFRLQRGQKVWECDVKAQEIREAEYEKSPVHFALAAKGAPAVMRHKLIMREGCLYVPAINVATARKKFLKMLFAHYAQGK